MSLRRLPSGAYGFELRRKALTGGRLSLSLRTDSQREARRRARALTDLADAGEWSVLERLRAGELSLEALTDALAPGGSGVEALRPEARSIRVREAVEATRLAIRGTSLRPLTLVQYETLLTAIESGLGAETPLHEITLDRARRWLFDEERRATTRNNYLSMARRVWAEGMRLERDLCSQSGERPRLLHNVWQEIKRAKAEPRFAWLEEEQYLVLESRLRALHPRYATFLACAFRAGLRLAETINLRRSDIDLDARTIAVRARRGAHAWRPKSVNSERTIPIGETLAQLLADFARSPESGAVYLFRTQHSDGRAPISRARGIEWAETAFPLAGFEYGRESNSGLTYHAGRHSAISWALRQGVPPSIVAEYAGDTVEVILSTYSHVLPHDLAKMSDALENSLRSSSEVSSVLVKRSRKRA